MFPLLMALVLPAPFDRAIVRFEGLLATLFDYQFEPETGRNGFSMGDARIAARVDFPFNPTPILRPHPAALPGEPKPTPVELDGEHGYREPQSGFGFYLQGNFIAAPALLDLALIWRANQYLIVDAGLVKVPFSEEFILPAQNLDFTDRSQAVVALAPDRQVGARVRGQVGRGALQYWLGLFNGNRYNAQGNDDNGFLVAARAATDQRAAGWRIHAGANVAAADDPALVDPFLGEFSGNRLLLGADARIEWGPWLLASEAIWGRLTPETGAVRSPFGYHVSAGYNFTDAAAIKARWDSFDDGLSTVKERVIVGLGDGVDFYSVWLDYVIPIDASVDAHRVLLTLQANWE